MNEYAPNQQQSTMANHTQTDSVRVTLKQYGPRNEVTQRERDGESEKDLETNWCLRCHHLMSLSVSAGLCDDDEMPAAVIAESFSFELVGIPLVCVVGGKST